jgi:hypothetical protein
MHCIFLFIGKLLQSKSYHTCKHKVTDDCHFLDLGLKIEKNLDVCETPTTVSSIS